jgi:hypothetical protein
MPPAGPSPAEEGRDGKKPRRHGGPRCVVAWMIEINRPLSLLLLLPIHPLAPRPIDARHLPVFVCLYVLVGAVAGERRI